MEAVEAVAGVLGAVAWIARASPAARGEVAKQDEVMYCQKASLSCIRGSGGGLPGLGTGWGP